MSSCGGGGACESPPNPKPNHPELGDGADAGAPEAAAGPGLGSAAPRGVVAGDWVQPTEVFLGVVSPGRRAFILIAMLQGVARAASGGAYLDGRAMAERSRSDFLFLEAVVSSSSLSSDIYLLLSRSARARPLQRLAPALAALFAPSARVLRVAAWSSHCSPHHGTRRTER